MEQKIVLRLKECVRLVCDWRLFISSAFCGVDIIHQQVFGLWSIEARILIGDRVLI